ncbi:MAG: DNA repair protein RecN, partial [Coriobacteriales bacterium]|nr:DNA repair protein RecN [Coriobacteriales bacterium]
ASIQIAQERLPRQQWTSEGPSRVEIMYRPGAGLTARPLRRIASGGEISRVMLACKVVLGEADSTETLVFDEVDAGVGGATAVALAKVLDNLARTHQVIVVTHLAQVAVMAQTHYLVSKSQGDVPESSLRQIQGQERVAEIARMLSGDESQASLAHAREMLEAAQAAHAASA